MTISIGGGPSERVRVTGFADVGTGERWCRVRFAGDRRTLLIHPSRLLPLA